MITQWTLWALKSALAAAIAFGIGLYLLLGLPGAAAISFTQALGFTPRIDGDKAWPLAILATGFGALSIVPASLLLRLAVPGVAGLRHAAATSVLIILAMVAFTIIIARAHAG